MVSSEVTLGDFDLAKISEEIEDGLDLFADRDGSSESSATSSTMYGFGVV